MKLGCVCSLCSYLKQTKEMELITCKTMQRLYIPEHADYRVEVCFRKQGLKTMLIVFE